MKYRKDKYGNDLSVLGFGCMRFTKKGTNIDIDKAEKEILAAFEAGVNYFDTAYVYAGSEAAVSEIFERNGIRDKINIATKLPQYLIGSNAALNKYFNEELSRLRTDHIDYYLMHHLTDVAMWEKLKAVGILEWIEEKKKEVTVVLSGMNSLKMVEENCRIAEEAEAGELKEADRALRPLPYKIGIGVARKFMFRKPAKS